MRTPPAIGLLFLSSAVWAAEVPMPAFPDAKIGLPPLSLSEAAKARMPLPFSDAAVQMPHAAGMPTRVPKTVSRMPVLKPKEIDTAMVMAPPDSGVHYTLKVKRPDVEQAE